MASLSAAIILAVAEEDAVEPALLERRPGLQRHLADARIVERVSLSREIDWSSPLILAAMPCAEQIGVGDAELHLIGHQRLLDRRLAAARSAPASELETPKWRTLPACVQRIEGRRDFLGLDQRIRPVQQQHVDIVGLQRHQRFIDRT